jgi:hypothetical protein
MAKMDEEGTFSLLQCIWGTDMQTKKKQASLPDAKLAKAAYLLNEPIYDWGRLPLPVLAVQRMRGNQQVWVSVRPEMVAELASANRVLGMAGEDGHITEKHGAADLNEALNDFWDSVEVMRIMISSPHRWVSDFTVGFQGVLSIPEQLALPGATEKVVWVGSDATLEVFGAIDWTNKTYTRHVVSPFFATLKTFTDSEEEEAIVSITENIGITTYIAQASHKWGDKIVIYPGDNMNTVGWLERKDVRCRMARHMGRVTTHLQVRNRFRLAPVYIRTYHNDTCDFITRASEAEVVQRLEKEMGFKRIDITGAWEEAITLGFARRALLWDKLVPGEA